MFPFRYRRTPKTPMPPWMKWCLMGFIALAIIAQMLKAPEERVSFGKVQQQLKLEQYQPLFNSGQLTIQQTTAGTGALAMCGQKVNVAYTQTYESSTEEGSAEFTLGDASALPALNLATYGMRVGEVRQVESPPQMAGKTPPSDTATAPKVKLELKLKSTQPALDREGELGLRAYDLKPGSGRAAQCGGEVLAEIQMWNTEGKQFYASKEPLRFILGNSQVPAAFDQALVSQMPGGVRTLIIPPAYQQPLFPSDGYLMKDVKFPKSQTIIAEVKLISPPKEEGPKE